jgi:hypothetical protein
MYDVVLCVIGMLDLKVFFCLLRFFQVTVILVSILTTFCNNEQG